MQCVDLGGRRIIKKNFFKQKTAYEISECLVGSEMCIRDRGVILAADSHIAIDLSSFYKEKLSPKIELILDLSLIHI